MQRTGVRHGNRNRTPWTSAAEARRSVLVQPASTLHVRLSALRSRSQSVWQGDPSVTGQVCQTVHRPTVRHKLAVVLISDIANGADNAAMTDCTTE